MNRDKYGEVLNGDETYLVIAKELIRKGSVIIGWTDGEYTHYDILFTINPYRVEDNNLQRGFRWTDLFVSILGISSYGFIIEKEATDSGYVAEKLNLGNNDTTDKVTELINNVKASLIDLKNKGGLDNE